MLIKFQPKFQCYKNPDNPLIFCEIVRNTAKVKYGAVQKFASIVNLKKCSKMSLAFTCKNRVEYSGEKIPSKVCATNNPPRPPPSWDRGELSIVDQKNIDEHVSARSTAAAPCSSATFLLGIPIGWRATISSEVHRRQQYQPKHS